MPESIVQTKNKVLNRNVVTLGLVSFLSDLSSEMLYPITPLFLTSVLGASMTNVGFIEGLAEGISSLLKTFSGRWSDRIQKRKPFVIAGYLLATLAKPLTGAAASWTEVLIARGSDRVGKGLRTAPRDALLAEAVAPELRGAAFGWHRLMDTMGAALGPLLAIWFLSESPESLRTIYYWAVIPGLLSVAVIFAVREKPVHDIQSNQTQQKWVWGDLTGDFKMYLFAWTVFSVANSSDVFLLMKAKQMGINFTHVIALYCFYNLVYALASPSLGGLSDRLGRKHLLIFGLGVFSFVYFGFTYASELWHFVALFGTYGLYMAATDGVGKALAVDLVDSRQKATGLGILGTFTGLATIISSTVAGLLWDRWGSEWTFYYGVAGGLASAAILSFVRERQPSSR